MAKPKSPDAFRLGFLAYLSSLPNPVRWWWLLLLLLLLHVHSWPINAHVSPHEGRELVSVPEEDHRVQHKAPHDRQCQIHKPVVRKGRLIDMKEQKQQKEKVGKIREPLAASQTHQRKSLDRPDNARNGKSQKLVSVVKLDQKEHHAEHDRNKNQILHQMSCDQIRDGNRLPDPPRQLPGKVEHPLLGFSECKGHEGRAKEEQKGRS
mmetsp:Transcript_13401/g.27730  ORF Transcript_13401/g.27730 Transcript_13401/m.27730 type:complete len:207 (+) Transcript_13401:1455-2075(+)